MGLRHVLPVARQHCSPGLVLNHVSKGKEGEGERGEGERERGEGEAEAEGSVKDRWK